MTKEYSEIFRILSNIKKTSQGETVKGTVIFNVEANDSDRLFFIYDYVFE